ncbi:MAG: Rne/Rng family ribonuclease [Deltaproteobacteria bacterium]|nr:Rne/Rng family ribonuclease [Deltaproteobacteria bacterium]
MVKKMLINATEPEECRVAVVADGRLEEFYLEMASREQTRGNIYKAQVENVEPSLEAAFIDYGASRNGFLQVGEIHPEYYPEDVKAKQPPIRRILKKNQVVLVQVTKEPTGTKGAALTTYVSLAGPSLVIMPGRGGGGGVSRKIEDEDERQRLKNILSELEPPPEVGVIIRTRAQGKPKREIVRDLNSVLRLWEEIKARVAEAPVPSLVHKEEDMALRTIRDHFSPDISEVLIDNKDLYHQVKEYLKIIAPRNVRRVKFYKEKRPIFAKYELEKQIETIYHNSVRLPSGGEIQIDKTEALVAIDVNSGKSTREHDIEKTAFKTNMEAAVEAARQLRLRDLGGLIVIDFIDMRDPKHNRAVVKAFRDEAKKDKARSRVGLISRFGLLELSRQRIRPSIEDGSYQVCPHCYGRGVVQSIETASLGWLRKIWQGTAGRQVAQVNARLPRSVADYLLNQKREEILNLERRNKVQIKIEGAEGLPPEEGNLDFVRLEADDVRP